MKSRSFRLGMLPAPPANVCYWGAKRTQRRHRETAVNDPKATSRLGRAYATHIARKVNFATSSCAKPWSFWTGRGKPHLRECVVQIVSLLDLCVVTECSPHYHFRREGLMNATSVWSVRRLASAVGNSKCSQSVSDWKKIKMTSLSSTSAMALALALTVASSAMPVNAASVFGDEVLSSATIAQPTSLRDEVKLAQNSGIVGPTDSRSRNRGIVGPTPAAGRMASLVQLPAAGRMASLVRAAGRMASLVRLTPAAIIAASLVRVTSAR